MRGTGCLASHSRARRAGEAVRTRRESIHGGSDAPSMAHTVLPASPTRHAPKHDRDRVERSNLHPRQAARICPSDREGGGVASARHGWRAPASGHGRARAACAALPRARANARRAAPGRGSRAAASQLREKQYPRPPGRGPRTPLLKPQSRPASHKRGGRERQAGHAVNPSMEARMRHPWRIRSCPPLPPDAPHHPRDPSPVSRLPSLVSRSLSRLPPVDSRPAHPSHRQTHTRNRPWPPAPSVSTAS